MLAGGVAVLFITAFLSLTQGLADISVHSVIQALLSPQDISDHHMIRGVRLPRTVMGLLSGAALAVSGALMQTVTRNPLASETTLGVNAGAYFIVVLGTIFWPALLHQHPLPFAVLGGACAAAAVYVMAGGRKGTPIRIALSGMIITLVFSSLTSALLLFNQETAQGIFLWGSGSLKQNDWSGVLFSWPWILGGIIVACLAARHLDLLSFSEETARSLGQKVGKTRLFVMAIAILAACVSVSVVGPIGFIGLLAPHLVRLSGMSRHAWLIPVSAIWGAAILTGSDMLARTFINAYGELPAGAITAAIGAPWLIWLALRVSRAVSTGSRSGQSLSMGSGSQRVAYPVWVILLSVLLAVLSISSLTSGTVPIPLSDVVAALMGQGDDFYRQILFELRLPRMLTAGLAGVALAVSGSLMQSAVRNPLADPQIVGVTSGASVGAILMLIAFPQLYGWMPIGAILGGIAASAIVYAISWRRGLNPILLTLVGIAVAAAGSAFVNILIIQAKMTAAPALAWMAGSTYGRGWTEVSRLAPTLAVLLPIAWWLGRKVDLLSFHDESSIGLGLQVRKTRLSVTLIAVLLSSIAASAVGAVGFIGLLAPHAARMLVGTSHRRSMAIAALLGAVLLAAADWIGRIVLIPRDIPSGIITALLGAPYLFFLMFKSARK
ncbi:Fe(3+)-hydroxamate ABC transporter permease FhuB [Paenibacillus sp. J2TS4]|uniref:Fe(3+)-hydroxamate ABC transporter permease FhuB n=1 Tax=Paenibacillus sp. J2TS4 TaxID=2807194 RepID=UPI001B1CC2FB|nr:Fe(3+)-hydroxamate ABC transporter permease FhuB [Paenibacillus sp. J2TS4]GIP31997.1 Fe3+-hydroxamate ABC transporter permease FhuB [Paenibacillus sp. J2TS4]